MPLPLQKPNWTTSALGLIATVIDPQPDHRAPALAEGNGVPYIGIRDLNEDGTTNNTTARQVVEEALIKQEKSFTIEPGDIVFGKVGTLGNPKHIKPLGRVALSATLVLIKPSIGTHRRFLKYALESKDIQSQTETESTGSTRAALGIQQIRKFRLKHPDYYLQERIASFLDHETTKLDQLVQKKQRLIELLQEKRQALITQAVTKGLDPNVPMKDSGIEWLGEVPEHWEITRNKTLFYELSDLNSSNDTELLTVSHITGVTRRWEKNVNMFLAETLIGYKKCRPGDLIINTMWAWMGALGVSPYDGVVSPSYNVYRARIDASLHPEFYDYLYRIPNHITRMKAFSTGVWESRLRLYPQVFLAMRTCLPPLSEQIKITQYLDEQTKLIEQLIEKTNTTISLYQEYRQALISAAVTGQIDVQNYVEAETEEVTS